VSARVLHILATGCSAEWMPVRAAIFVLADVTYRCGRCNLPISDLVMCAIQRLVKYDIADRTCITDVDVLNGDAVRFGQVFVADKSGKRGGTVDVMVKTAFYLCIAFWACTSGIADASAI
jgi:hypothetical protein